MKRRPSAAAAVWSPMFEEYFRMHCRHPAILAFQAGDRWEFLFDEAEQVAALLGLSVSTCGTKPSGEPIAICSIPAGTAFTIAGESLQVPLVLSDHPFGKIVAAGHPVAVATHAPEPREAPEEHRIVAVIYPETWVKHSVGNFVTLVGKVEALREIW